MKEILNTSFRVFREDQSCHKFVGFDVVDNFDKLIFETSYCPKYLDDDKTSMSIIKNTIASEGAYLKLSDEQLALNFPLKNHISWSFDSPSKFVGTKHLSWQKQTHFVSAQDASFGLFPTQIEKGKWRVTASLNCIVTEWIDINIIV
ncbi:MAG: hypothetical protein RR348_01525, partial [Clostridia bacterium]